MDGSPEFFHSYIAMFLGILVTYLISRWYYKRREELFDIWDEHRELYLHLYYQTAGIAYRHFKITFKNLLQKEQIYEQDYAVYKTQDYTRLRSILTSNQESCDQTYERHQSLISTQEWKHVQLFFSVMFRFMGHFESHNDRFDSYNINNLQQSILKFEKECVRKFPNFLQSGVISGKFFVKATHEGAPFK